MAGTNILLPDESLHQAPELPSFHVVQLEDNATIIPAGYRTDRDPGFEAKCPLGARAFFDLTLYRVFNDESISVSSYLASTLELTGLANVANVQASD